MQKMRSSQIKEAAINPQKGDHTCGITVYLATADNKGNMKPQGHIQVLTSIIDFGLNPQEALDDPRWQWIGEKTIEVEPGIDRAII